MLSDEEKRLLLKIARQSVEAAVYNQTMKHHPEYPQTLKEHSGAFVTLHEHEALRGCIGYVEAIMPLAETVADVAAKAAMEDPRFMPVTPEELPDIEIELSVISPMKKITDINEIEIGKHGLMITASGKRGLLLPQVPKEYGWKRETFLVQTCRKAGLPPQAWQQPQSEIFIFTAEIFNEQLLSVVSS